MKANEAPEKLYFENNEGILAIYSNRDSNDEVEYTRTDAFIEKAAEYLQKHLIDYWLQGVTDESDFIEDFRKYMEGE